jgi:hypothetical protein
MLLLFFGPDGGECSCEALVDFQQTAVLYLLLSFIIKAVGVCADMRGDTHVNIAKCFKGQFSSSRTGEVVAGLVGSCLRHLGKCSRSWPAALPPGRLLGLLATLQRGLLNEVCSSLKLDEAKDWNWLIPT